jgi:hypothetical protein
MSSVAPTEDRAVWRGTLIFTVVVLLAVLAGYSTAIPQLSQAQERTRYLAVIAPVETANIALSKVDTSGITTAQYQAANAPFLAVLGTFDNAVLNIGLTGKAATDAQRLVTADKVVIARIRGLTASDGWQLPLLEQDGAAANRDQDALQADLGLPPGIDISSS